METNQYDENNQFGTDVLPAPEEEFEDNDVSEESSEQDDGDEIPESLPEHSMENYPEEESEPEPVKPQTKKKDKAQARINQIQREKYQAQYALQQAQLENERLRKMFDESTKIGAKQYEVNLNNRIDKAKQQLQQAIESGDPQAQAEAQVEISAATSDINYMNNWKAQEAIKEQQQQYYQQQPQNYAPEPDPYEMNEGDVHGWLEENEWFNPRSQSFDRDKAHNVDHYSRLLNAELVRTGNAHYIGTPDYFAAIDKQAQMFDEYRQQQGTQQHRRDLNMKPVRGGASVPRSGAPTQGKREIRISAEEKDMARRMGVSDEAYLRARIADERENAHKRRGGY